jgi:hypothetical protein
MLRLTLGVANDATVCVDVPEHPVEFDLDDVFWAANRIGDLPEDLGRFEHDWMRQIRQAIDDANAPSMSVDDLIEMIDDHGRTITCWEVAGSGFRAIVNRVHVWT